MAIDKELRLEGIYGQRQKGYFMQRIKLPGGIISSDQALKVAAIAEGAARGVAHLTTRGSIQLHWLSEADLVPVAAQLASVGLVSRGACGGAVRGVVCGSLSAPGAPALEALVRKLHRHFTGNPRFEKLPKKFKIGIEADTSSRRHLIQDVGLVAAASDDGRPRYDVYVAGGLGRLPTPGFLLAERVLEDSLIPLIEVVVRIYAENTPPPKRLKHLIAEIGEEEFRSRVFQDPAVKEELPTVPTLSGSLVPVPENESQRLEARVFAGELQSHKLAALAGIAQDFCGGIMMVTGEQNIVMHLINAGDVEQAQAALRQAGFETGDAQERVNFRICPGNHECIYGLSATRDVSEALLERMSPSAQKLVWAISGCPNSCAQPQLAEVGIISSRATKEGEELVPRFDLYRPGSAPLAHAVQQGLTLEELLEVVKEL
jgi:sulfite reductase (ferredoxin)